MLLTALSLATTLVIASPPRAEAPMPNLYRQPGYCRQVVEREVARQEVALKSRGDLRSGLQYAVFRSLDGCAVPIPVGYHPATLPGAADVPPDTPKREDAPSNRR
jgi:hypothetical protein